MFAGIESQRIEGFVTATTLTDIFYIVRRETKSIERARDAVSRTMALMEISPVNRRIMEAAFASNLRDFEDAVQLACATAQSLDAIVTRDRSRFC